MAQRKTQTAHARLTVHAVELRGGTVERTQGLQRRVARAFVEIAGIRLSASFPPYLRRHP
jgi:hypothetical protein